uniref:Uncharacterized protein n=1 Tax=Anguilla anguilla TaxID=7936 RepID=A0A0E9SMQ6_ANGAN
MLTGMTAILMQLVQGSNADYLLAGGDRRLPIGQRSQT